MFAIKITKDFAKNIFTKVDTNQDGKWSFDEAVTFLPKLDKKLRDEIDNTKLKEIFNSMDLNGDSHVDKAEFKKALNEKLKEVIDKKISSIDKYKHDSS